MQEELPLWLRKEYHLAERNFAIENIHFPKTEQGFHDARKRLVFEELFLLQTTLYQLKSTLEERGEGIRLKKKKALQDGEILQGFLIYLNDQICLPALGGNSIYQSSTSKNIN